MCRKRGDLSSQYVIASIALSKFFTYSEYSFRNGANFRITSPRQGSSFLHKVHQNNYSTVTSSIRPHYPRAVHRYNLLLQMSHGLPCLCFAQPRTVQKWLNQSNLRYGLMWARFYIPLWECHF